MFSWVRVALVCVVLALLPGTEARGADAELPLDQQVGQLVVLSFRGTTPPAYVRVALRERHAAGVILFGGNVASSAQLRALTSTLRDAGGRPFVAVDQEGGPVRRVPWVGPIGPESQQVAAGIVRSDAETAAKALRGLGVTVTLAPVADVPSVRNAAIASRAFSTQPAVVSTSVADAVRGWLAGGVAPTAKHFPGIGGAPRNTDAAVVTIFRSRAALDRVDLAVLRDRLGFRSVVITDSLEARASLSTGSITKVAERAIRAGADLVLLTERGSYRPVYDHLLAVARRDPAFRVRVQQAAARVWRLKAAS
jgi:beta-N-acetylhexosaminidase